MLYAVTGEDKEIHFLKEGDDKQLCVLNHGTQYDLLVSREMSAVQVLSVPHGTGKREWKELGRDPQQILEFMRKDVRPAYMGGKRVLTQGELTATKLSNAFMVDPETWEKRFPIRELERHPAIRGGLFFILPQLNIANLAEAAGSVQEKKELIASRFMGLVLFLGVVGDINSFNLTQDSPFRHGQYKVSLGLGSKAKFLKSALSDVVYRAWGGVDVLSTFLDRVAKKWMLPVQEPQWILCEKFRKSAMRIKKKDVVAGEGDVGEVLSEFCTQMGISPSGVKVVTCKVKVDDSVIWRVTAHFATIARMMWLSQVNPEYAFDAEKVFGKGADEFRKFIASFNKRVDNS